MKTTIEIADPLLDEVRQIAKREGVTLRTLVERGLYRVVSETKENAPFKLRDARFMGNGLQPEFQDVSWDRLRDAIYETNDA